MSNLEKKVIEGFNNNVIGTLSCIEASINTSISNFVLISTDKAVRPTNVMGATKRVSEMLVQAYAEENKTSSSNSKIKFSIVRFGNVLGSMVRYYHYLKTRLNLEVQLL